MFKRVLEGFLRYRSGEPELEEVYLWKIDPFVGGSASPFIDKGDGFTSERVRVHMLLSFGCPCRRVQDNGRRLQHC